MRFAPGLNCDSQTAMTDLALSTRTGLPDELRILAEIYPRDLWRGHANFNEMTAFWLDRHGMFRDLSDRLIGLCQTELDTPGDRFVPEMGRYASFFLNQLHSHHMVEDHHYFPQFVGLDQRIAAAFDLLDADHHALDAQMQALADAANHVIRQGADRDGVARLLTVQNGMQKFLDRHLADEEEVIVPLVLEYGPDIA